jgi:putative endonuclease
VPITTYGFPDPVTIAAEYLNAHGLTVIDRCWQDGHAESGIVAAGQHVLVVCHVTSRSASAATAGTQGITPAVLRLLRNHGEAWLTAHDPGTGHIRIDLITVTYDGPGGYTLEHVKAVG